MTVANTCGGLRPQVSRHDLVSEFQVSEEEAVSILRRAKVEAVREIRELIGEVERDSFSFIFIKFHYIFMRF